MNTKRLLVVDDDPDVRELLLLSLLDSGWQVDGTGTGADALERCRAGQVDGLLLDLEMPGVSGRDVLAQVALDGPPVVFVTASHEPALDAELVAAGALAVLPKPFDPLRIGHQVGSALGWVTTTDGPPEDHRLAG
ncbi:MULTISPECIES: response regulator [Actinosynnema]|uniref:response regulator n=1 Tax=Actinosynnema TaxID=40566 RepID=UPI0020A2BA92|nr:response regulator [Actinosynnema pretiosum]MCP2097077.1 Response regulator receiver domain-containing protein [Actinosynnema pretiosum]